MTERTAIASARWYIYLRQSSNTTFMPLYFDTHRYLVLKGGGGSGKSIFAGRKIIERCVSEPHHRFLVCRKVARTLRESCFKQLCSQIEQHYGSLDVTVNRSDMKITFPSGSQIIFAGLDDVEKLKSIYGITGIWIEEASELSEFDFNQLDIRLRGRTDYYKQIILTFNPISVMHWLKRRFFDSADHRARVHESSYRDNRFLDEEAIRTLENFREIDDYYYTVYCLGEWGVTGRSVFNAREVMRRLASCPEPRRRGIFEYDEQGGAISNIRWRELCDGPVLIYEDAVQGVPYVIGGDTAGEGSDFFVSQVIDNTSGVQVAMLRHRTDEDLYAKQLYCLGLYYNTALIGVETNYSTYPVRELERLSYPRQYVRESMDDYTHALKRSFGFVTDAKSRPVIISGLISALRGNLDAVCDRTTLEEMSTFVRDESFRASAQSGAHDDCVMALAIAHHIRPQQSYQSVQEQPRSLWSESMLEDYANADREGREYLIKKWGIPKK